MYSYYKHMQHQDKHLQHTYKTPTTLEIYACNMYMMYFYNIQMKHLKRTSETLETYACNMHI
jgi:hypothetical protein